MAGRPVERYERVWAGSSRVKTVLALTHPTAVCLSTATALVLAFVAGGGRPFQGARLGPLLSLLCLGLAVAFCEAAIGISNEVFDAELDAASKPWRAIPAGHISRRRATWLALAAGAVALLLAAVLSWAALLVMALGLAAGVLYSARLKRTPLSWLPYAIAYPLLPLWVWMAAGRFEPDLLVIYPVAVPFALAVHLVNQLRDYDEDLAMGIKSLVHYLGKERAGRWCAWLLPLCPLPALLLPGRPSLPGGVFLLLAAGLHWLLIAAPLGAYRQGGDAAGLRRLFRRLQASGPLMVVSWLASLADR